MKARIFLVFALIIILSGCRAKKAVIDESSFVSYVDTTKTTADSVTASRATISTETDSLQATDAITDTTKTATSVEESAVIDFVDGGGTVSIDTAGNLTLAGVKSIKGNLRQRQVANKGFTHTKDLRQAHAKNVADSDEITQTHNQAANGVKADEQKQHHQASETNTVRPKWYQSVLAKIGGLCCIAALLWLIFLYLKRKF